MLAPAKVTLVAAGSPACGPTATTSSTPRWSAVDLYDELTFTAAPASALEIVGSDLAGRRRQPRRCGRWRPSAARPTVRLTKRIPPGAGLGGGSADAAAVLRWAGVVDDVALAARLGADVPFCVRGGRARVTGIGEVLEPLAVRRAHPARC